MAKTECQGQWARKLTTITLGTEMKPGSPNNTGDDHEYDDGHGLAVKPGKPELKRPPMYKVLLLNDDFTPMDFVVYILETFFSMDRHKATQVMLSVHTEGKGLCGVFTQDVAETKMAQVNDYSRQNQHPLLSSVEPD